MFYISTFHHRMRKSICLSCDHDQVTITLALFRRDYGCHALGAWNRIDRNVKQLGVPVAVLLSTLQLSRYQSRKRVFRVGRAFRCFVSRSFRSCSIADPLCFVKRFSEQFWRGSENSFRVSSSLSEQVRRPGKRADTSYGESQHVLGRSSEMMSRRATLAWHN